MEPAPAPPRDRQDAVSLADEILSAAETNEAGRGGPAAIAAAAAVLIAEDDVPPPLLECARLLAVGAYFDGRGDGTTSTAARLTQGRLALEKAAFPESSGRRFPHIGRVRSPWSSLAGMPLQTVAAEGVAGRIELLDELAPAVRDLVDFSHAWILCDLDRSSGYDVEVVPFLDDRRRGLFATRSPRRPSPIGLSLVRVVGVEEATILVEDLDLLDGTPVLDVKPYVPLFDARETTKIGWFAEAGARVFEVRSDGRYAEPSDVDDRAAPA